MGTRLKMERHTWILPVLDICTDKNNPHYVLLNKQIKTNTLEIKYKSIQRILKHTSEGCRNVNHTLFPIKDVQKVVVWTPLAVFLKHCM